VFQSAPNPKVGRYGINQCHEFCLMTLFQSAPNPKVGRYQLCPRDTMRAALVSIRSQPEGREIPRDVVDKVLDIKVSIRSQPEGREIPWLKLSLLVEKLVSIRSQPEGREIPKLAVLNDIVDRCFNPLPTRRSGDTWLRSINTSFSRCFNPLPTRRSGDTVYKD